MDNPFKSTKGIIDEIHSIVEDVKIDEDAMKQCDLRLRACKHAIQVHALSFEYARYKGIKTDTLKPMVLE